MGNMDVSTMDLLNLTPKANTIIIAKRKLNFMYLFWGFFRPFSHHVLHAQMFDNIRKTDRCSKIRQKRKGKEK